LTLIKEIITILFLIPILATSSYAYVPVTYNCCINYVYDQGGLLDNFENLSNWSIQEGSQSADIVNFKEGSQGLKLITDSSRSATDKVINNDFSNTNNIAFWLYVYNASTFSNVRIYLTSIPSGSWSSYFTNQFYGVKTGWNRIIFGKNSFSNYNNESWNNVMTRMRIAIYPFSGSVTSATIDDLRYNVTGKRAKMIISFDDGLINVSTDANPILTANNQPATAFIITGQVGNVGQMNLTDLRNLQTKGWDISSHTISHADLSTLDDSTLINELNGSYDWLVTNNFQKSAGFIAYPYGSFNDKVIDYTKKRYVLGRSITPQSTQQHFDNSDDAELYIQRIVEVYNITTVQYVEDQINDSMNSKLLGELVFHNIVDSNPTTYDYLRTDLQKISDYLKSRASDIDVVTYSDYMIPNINSFTPVINKTTRICPNGSSVLMDNNKYDEYMPNMTVRPLSDSVDIKITSYNESGGLIELNESSYNNGLQVSYNVGDRIPNSLYSVKIYWTNGTIYNSFNVLANNTGYIQFLLTLDGDSIVRIDHSSSIDTSFTVTLPIGYTFLRFNASMSTVTNLSPDGQNDSQPTFNIINNGNINQSFMLVLNGTVSNITTYAALNNNFSGKVEISTSSSMVIPNLFPGSNQYIWMIIDVNKAPVTNANMTLMINSNNS